jgi:4-amino-4-deoxy-L-arabinose transferase-like glycosyltransferase
MAPVILNNATRLSMNPFEPLFWMGCVYFLLRAINHNQPKMLVWCGVMLGLGLENKHSTAFFFTSLLAGLLATSARRLILTKRFWIAAAIALLIFLPNLLWQVQHHFPTLEALRNVKATHKNVELPPLAFLRQQIMMLNRASVFVWIAGLGFLLVGRGTKSWRALGITYLVFLGVMMVLKGKDYYLAPIYPMLYAAGGVFWETLAEARAGWRWVRVALPATVIAVGLIAVPLVVPFCRWRKSSRIWKRSESKCRARKYRIMGHCRNILAMNLDGRKWFRKWRKYTTRFRRNNARRRGSSRELMGMLGRSISSDRDSGCRSPSAGTRIIIFGGRGNTQVKV